MKAATLVFAREHLVDFFDFDISEVVFLCEAECPPPVVVILENISDSDKSDSMDTGENCDDVYFG